MKRRNADCGKIRRPIKRNKITESMHSNTLLYTKFLILWIIVIIADFMLEFRFEFLWPFWLLLRSVHDSFKYKGLAFSVLFVCIAITSDLICLFFIPVHWLFFAASTYVWVQYVWHTDKGICLPTIILWILFVYLEAAIRWKDSRHMPHLDLCRPFAAHCIGYPVVSLGFGFKSYVGHLMRIRKQREVAKENEFYMQLLQQALPQLPPTPEEQSVCLAGSDENELHSNNTTGLSNGSGIQTLNGDISCGSSIISPGSVSSSSSSPLVSGLVALTVELIKDLISTAVSVMTGATQHLFSGGNSNNNNNNAQTTTNNSSSSSSSNKVLSLGGGGGASAGGGDRGSSINGHAVSVQNGTAGNHHSAAASTATSNSTLGKDHRGGNSSLQSSSTGTSSASTGGGGTASSNGGVRKQSHNGGGSLSEKESKCDFSHNKGAGSYHPTSSASASGGASTMLSAALVLGTVTGSSVGNGTVGGNGVEREKPGIVNNNNSKDYASMNGSSSSSGKSGGNEYHQKEQQQLSQSKESNSRLANNHNHQSSSNSMNGTSHYGAQEKSTAGDTSTNHNPITSASSSPLSMTSSCSSSEANSGVGGGGENKGGSGKRGGDGDGHGHTNGGQTTEKAGKGKKNRSKQKQDELSLMQICTSCSRWEAEVKRLKGDVSHMKQIENELKQRTDTNANLKANLQAKNKEAEELDKKIHELTLMKQNDRQMLNSLEQRVGYEQRQRKQLETMLNSERKLRIKAEEKAAKCYSEIASIDEKKKSAELQNRSYEVEMRKMENELRNRDSEEVLLSALQTMQEKNLSLEKSLSCETRFKLDLFSALGEARRQIELKDGLISKQADEITDLKAKIAQLVAIIPIMPISPSRPESVGYHHASPTSPVVVSSSGSMMRLSNGSPLMVTSNHQDMNNNGKMMGQSPQPQMFIQQQSHHQMAQQQQQHQQQQQQGLQSASSTLDPNARAYTPVTTNSDSV